MLAYTGTSRIDGNRWITRVEVSWNPSWGGTEQERTFELHGDALRVPSTWFPPAEEQGGPFRGVITWRPAS